MLLVYDGRALHLPSLPGHTKKLPINELIALYAVHIERIALHQELVATTRSASATVSELMKNLVERGFVVQGKLKSDARVTCYTLTAKGKRLFEQNPTEVTIPLGS